MRDDVRRKKTILRRGIESENNNRVLRMRYSSCTVVDQERRNGINL